MYAILPTLLAVMVDARGHITMRACRHAGNAELIRLSRLSPKARMQCVTGWDEVGDHLQRMPAASWQQLERQRMSQCGGKQRRLYPGAIRQREGRLLARALPAVLFEAICSQMDPLEAVEEV